MATKKSWVHWGRRLLGAAAVTAMVAGMTAMFASPASAALVGVEIVTEYGSYSVEAECPAGKVLVGTGAYVAYGTNVRIKDITPSRTGVEVEGVEDDDQTGLVPSVRADAICAAEPLGYELVDQPEPSGSNARMSAVAECTGDNEVLGTAAEIGGISTGDVMIDTVRPAADRVTVSANEDQNGTGVNWSVTAWAICADPSVGQTIRSEISQATSSGKSQGETCTSGTVTGVGGELSGPYGQLSLSALKPSEYDGTPIAFAQGAEDDDGMTWNWTVTTYVICA